MYFTSEQRRQRNTSIISNLVSNVRMDFLSQQTRGTVARSLHKAFEELGIMYSVYAVQNDTQKISSIPQDQVPFDGFVEKSKVTCFWPQ